MLNVFSDFETILAKMCYVICHTYLILYFIGSAHSKAAFNIFLNRVELYFIGFCLLLLIFVFF